ncbi:AAA family ATPase [endosymbiont GvMRE of Glomus versiforme]|uniref:AAA family ATPase n=1 Tax=endosymbiont GvMRE of Glomus versiforme TaxID=2039283 RepID=UPI000EC3BF1D|nr:AAA family ATPase [endosymbiont GvMRE of Glomus versiforme]RHZ37530.1 hypothetical protein GvMRE_I1g390 [endosymbiont GvMRE of Glomus versiforme]
MNKLLEETLVKEKISRKCKKAQDKDNVKDFSWVLYFVGEEYNQELAQKEQVNLIDFGQHNRKNPEFIEKKIKEIYNNPQNKELVEKGDFPLIWFKNIDNIEKNQALEESLLPVFDPQQNSELFHGEVDLSKFILIATTSTRDTGKLSKPLRSRLDCVNVKTAQTKQFFWDKTFWWWLAPSLLINLILVILLLVPKFRKPKKPHKITH